MCSRKASAECLKVGYRELREREPREMAFSSSSRSLSSHQAKREAADDNARERENSTLFRQFDLCVHVCVKPVFNVFLWKTVARTYGLERLAQSRLPCVKFKWACGHLLKAALKAVSVGKTEF